LKYTLEKTGDDESVTVAVTGDLTIYTVAQLKEDFKSIINHYKKTEIDFSGIRQVDTAGIQLLLFFKKYNDSADHQLIFRSHSRELLKYMDLYGTAGMFTDKIALKKEDKDVFRFSYGLKKHPEAK